MAQDGLNEGCENQKLFFPEPLVEEYGMALAVIARRVGVSTSAISKIMQRVNK